MAAYGLTRTPGGGFLAVGSRGRYGYNATNDMLALACDADGDSLWSQSYATDQLDQAFCVAVCPDSGFLLGGVMGNIFDLGLVRINSVGDEQWRKIYGGGGNDKADELCATADSGFIIAGYTSASGTADAWLLKTNAGGDTIWTLVRGGGGNDVATGVVEVPGFGYGVAGTTSTWGAGSNDFLFIGTDLAGNVLSQMTFGGSASDGAGDICPATGGGYALAGSSSSFGAGGSDVYLVLVPGPTGIEEPREEKPRPRASSQKRLPTIVRGVLFLTASPFTLHCSLFSLSGQKALDLRPGPNDVGHLAPGVYFMYGARAQAVRKVVVTK